MPRLPFDPSRLRQYPQPMSDLVAALVQRQEGSGEIDTGFAERLGVSVHLWRKTRSGSVPLGWKLWSGGAELVSYQLGNAAQAAIMERTKRRWPKRNGQAA